MDNGEIEVFNAYRYGAPWMDLPAWAHCSRPPNDQGGRLAPPAADGMCQGRGVREADVQP